MKKVFLVPDTPSEIDSFGHVRVSNAIHQIIENEPGGKAIGLEGAWGSGKSTVINILFNKFIHNENIIALKFDAWAHQGDPLRRSYLETLINEFKNDLSVSKKDLSKIESLLSNTKNIQTTTVKSRPTWLGIIFAISLMCVPISAVLSDLSASKLVCMCLALAPLMVLGVNFVLSLIKEHNGTELSWKDWAFILNSGGEEVKTNTIESMNPTSIEFERLFEDVTELVLKNDVNKRLVLVLDNIDRLDIESAKTIWATLQIFFQEKPSNRNKWFSQIWFIVPYDPRRVDGEIEGNISESIIEKCFQVRFHVSPPVLSDWKKYLEVLVQSALPDHDEAEKFSVYLAYERWLNEGRKNPPTPRELKSYVNQVGSVLRQWGDIFPVGHVGYYVLHSRKPSLIESIRTGDIPTPTASRALGNNLVESLSGLVFNTHPQKGMEILLSDPIKQSIFNLRVKDFHALEESHKDGFWPVLSGVLANSVGAIDIMFISNFGLIISNPKFTFKNDIPEMAAIKLSLRHAIAELKTWVPFSGDVAQGVILCAKFLGTSEYSTVIKPISKYFNSHEIYPDDVNDVSKGLVALSKWITTNGHTSQQSKIFKPRLTADSWINACQILVEEKSHEYLKLFSPILKEDLASHLFASLTSGVFNQIHLNAIIISQKVQLGVNWDSLISPLVQKIQVDSNLRNSKSVAIYFAALDRIELSGNTLAKQSLAKLVSNGHLYNYIARDEDFLPLGILLHLKFNASGVPPISPGSVPFGNRTAISKLEVADPDLAKRMVYLLNERLGEVEAKKYIEVNMDSSKLFVECNEILKRTSVQN